MLIAAAIILFFVILQPQRPSQMCTRPYTYANTYSTGKNSSSVTFSYSNKVANDKRSLLTADKNGTFHTRGIYHTGHFPQSIISADFNNDGKVDVAVAHDDNICILLGDGSGTFESKQYYNADGGVVSFAVGDFNNDSKTDLAAVSLLEYKLLVFLNQCE